MFVDIPGKCSLRDSAKGLRRQISTLRQESYTKLPMLGYLKDATTCLMS